MNIAISGKSPGPSSLLTPNEIIMHVDYFTVKTVFSLAEHYETGKEESVRVNSLSAFLDLISRNMT